MKTRFLIPIIIAIGVIGFTSSTFAQDLPPCTSDRSACFEPTNCINTLWDCPDNSDIFSIVIESEPEPPTISDEQDQMIREYCETGIRHPDMMGIPQCVKEPDCGSNTFLNKIGVCEVLDNGCKPDAYGNFYDCKPHYDYWKILFSSPIALLVVFGTPSLIAGIVIGVIIWRKRK